MKRVIIGVDCKDEEVEDARREIKLFSGPDLSAETSAPSKIRYIKMNDCSPPKEEF